MRLAERMSHIDASGIRRMFELASRLENPVNLSIGQPDFDVPEPLKEAAVRAIREGRNGYTPTQGLEALRERISAHLRRRGIEHEMVLVTPGASAGLTLAFMVLAGPGDEILVPDPYFVSYRQLARACGARPVYYDTYPDFLPRPERMEEVLSERTVALVVNSPNNPTGAVYGEQTVRAVVEFARRHRLTVISDECYDAFWYGEPPASPGRYYPQTVTVNSFSKLSAMTGWRLGYAAGPRWALEAMATLQQFTFVCAPQPVQWAALEAFEVDFEPVRRAYRRKRDLLYRGIRDHYRVKEAAGAFYLYPQVPAEGMTGEEFCLRAVERRLLAVPGGVFSRRDGHFRLSFAAPEEALEEGAEILRGLAEELAP